MNANDMRVGTLDGGLRAILTAMGDRAPRVMLAAASDPEIASRIADSAFEEALSAALMTSVTTAKRVLGRARVLGRSAARTVWGGDFEYPETDVPFGEDILSMAAEGNEGGEASWVLAYVLPSPVSVMIERLKLMGHGLEDCRSSRLAAVREGWHLVNCAPFMPNTYWAEQERAIRTLDSVRTLGSGRAWSYQRTPASVLAQILLMWSRTKPKWQTLTCGGSFVCCSEDKRKFVSVTHQPRSGPGYETYFSGHEVGLDGGPTAAERWPTTYEVVPEPPQLR